MVNSLTASRKNNPCPICGRTKDTDCRWSDDVILCHQGRSFGPPAELQVGDTITIEGKAWALVSRKGGFDGSAAVFKPHRPGQKPQQRSLPSHRPAAPDLSQQRKESIEETIKCFLLNYQACWDLPDFFELNYTQQREGFDLIIRTDQQGQFLASKIQSAWRDFPELKNTYKDLFEMAVQSLKYQRKEVDHFLHHYLGELPL